MMGNRDQSESVCIRGAAKKGPRRMAAYAIIGRLHINNSKIKQWEDFDDDFRAEPWRCQNSGARNHSLYRNGAAEPGAELEIQTDRRKTPDGLTIAAQEWGNLCPRSIHLTGGSSTPRLLVSIPDAPEYWVARSQCAIAHKAGR
jgi:hypothetical protein